MRSADWRVTIPKVAVALFTFAAGIMPMAAQTAQLLSVRQDLRIDGNAADLTRIVQVAVAPNGTIIVVQPDDHHLRYFSPAGQELGRFGRAGEGPGEFQSMGIHSGWIGDTFWQGTYPPRVVVVGPDRKLVRTITLPPLRPQARLLFHNVVGVRPSGELLVQGSLWRTPSNPSWARAITDSVAGVLLRVDASGTIRQLIAVTPRIGHGCYQLVNGRQRPTPECPRWEGVMSPSSDRYVWAQSHMKPGGSSALQVTSIRAEGDTAFVREIAIALDPITPRQADSIRRARIAEASGVLLKQDFAAMKFPTVWNPLHGIVAGNDGRTWIGLRGQHGERPWLVLGADGALIGRAMLKEGVRVVAANSTHLFGIETDADGVQSVVRYRVGG
jgi:hypothetical protein